MKNRITDKNISAVLNTAIKKKIISEEDTSAVFYDLTFLKERIVELKKCFPSDTLHAIAVKANPLVNILKLIAKLNVGLETASLPELYLARKSKFTSNKIVFDSPVKTKAEIEYALKLGIHINADSLEELKIIDDLLNKRNSKSTIGLRINPQVGTGKIKITSVAGEYSKFGVPVKYRRKEIVEAYKKYKWLSGIHLHIGSQGISLSMLLKGIKIVYNLAEEINEILEKDNRKIKIFDIGGGLPVSYDKKKKSVSVKKYTAGIKKACPKLFTNNYKLITEFGRWIHVNSGWTVSRVEYVKEDAKVKTAALHAGADMFLREIYNPGDWKHEIIVFNKNGNIKRGKDKKKYVLAGPLCFAGDAVAVNISLPKINKDDYVVVKDTGGYTLSMWSRYNSRQIPKVVGYYNNGKKFVIIKERETLDKIFKSWG
jgi:diaminopimelate decarboxylase